MESLDNLKLYVEPATFAIVQTNNKNIMVIDKIKRTVEMKDNFTLKKKEFIPIVGILGIIEAQSTSYLVIIVRVNSVGFIGNAEIFKIEELRFLPCVNSLTVVGNDEKFISMFNSFLLRNSLYYSDLYDLTNSSLKYFNKLATLNTGESYSINKNLNQNYCWNYNLLKQFLNIQTNNITKVVINGFVGIKEIKGITPEQSFNFILISRKDKRRSGVRYIVRGNDDIGNSANFAETEEIITYREKNDEQLMILSYFILRGSVPLSWGQKRDLSYNPLIKPKEDLILQSKTFELHLNNLKNDYEKVIFVNLIDKKKDQKTLGEMFETVSKDRCDFVWFDFHAECRNMKYENLSKLLDIKHISENVKDSNLTFIKLPNNFKFGLSHEGSIKIISTQKAVFRVNCVDSLDRSNVVQSVLIREMTKLILTIISNNTFTDKQFPNQLEFVYKNIWADNGDQLAMSYSGTNALKGDYTRFGKKSIKGTLQDGIYSVKRYFINNFGDGYNQDAHDFSLGNLSNLKSLNVQNHSTFFLKVHIAVIFLISYYLFKFTSTVLSSESSSLSSCFVRYFILILIILISSRYVFKKNKNLMIDNSTIDYEK